MKWPPKRHPGNPVVFFDVTLGGEPLGRIRFELFADVAPRTAENFRQFCTGEFRAGDGTGLSLPVGYKGCLFHRVIAGYMIQSGDFERHDGTGGYSIYGKYFDDENFALKHDEPGLLSTVNSRPNTNGSQFIVTCGPCTWLNDKNVVFGKVLDEESLFVVRKIEAATVDAKTSKPVFPIAIKECGEL